MMRERGGKKENTENASIIEKQDGIRWIMQQCFFFFCNYQVQVISSERGQ